MTARAMCIPVRVPEDPSWAAGPELYAAYRGLRAAGLRLVMSAGRLPFAEQAPGGIDHERRWVAWKHRDHKKPPVGKDGQPTKDWNDPRTWLTREEAEALRAEVKADGVGFVLGDGWGGLDLDECRNRETGELDPRALAVLDLVPGARVEVSPSGKGVKVVGKAARWLELNFKEQVTVRSSTAGYFTVTGDVYRDGSWTEEVPVDVVAAYFGKSRSTDPADKPPPLPAGGGPVLPGGQDDAMTREARALRGRNYDEPAIAAALWGLVESGRFPNEPGREPWTRLDCEEKARRVCARFEAGEDPFETDDVGAADFFARAHANVRFDHRQRRWLVFDGTRWAPDQDGAVHRLLAECQRARVTIANRIDKDELRKARLTKLANGCMQRKLRDVLDAAKSRPSLASRGDEWDMDPWVLGVPNGVVDLRTGELRSARAEDLITMQAAFAYDPEARCPLWEATIADVFRDNPELVTYVQRALGYSITGDCREEVFFLLTGDGRNGKGTVINTVSKVLGDYADGLAFHSLERGRDGDKSTNDLAKLVHKRFVTASETSGTRLNEARIKTMTGRDPITARFLYAEEFTFQAELKLWLSVNHLPRVHDDSAGFWSRPHRVPFLQSYKGRENKELKDQLLAEGSGILAWLVRGCLAWQRGGLLPPPAVTAAVEDYRRSQEPLAEFFREETVEGGQGAKVPASVLFNRYRGWCDEKRLIKRLGRNQFNEEVGKRFRAERTRDGQTFFGLRVADHGPDGQGEIL